MTIEDVELRSRERRRFDERPAREVGAQPRKRPVAQPRRRRARTGAIGCERVEACERVCDEALQIVAQQRSAQQQIEKRFGPTVGSRKTRGDPDDVGEAYRENDVVQIEVVVVAVDAADSAVVVGIRVNGDDDCPEAVGVRIERAVEDVPAAWRRPGDRCIDEMQPACSTLRRRAIEAVVDARVAEDQHVA